MPYLNSTVLMGHLTRDPELKSLASGTTLANGTIAVNNRKKNSATGAWEDSPAFIDFTVFGKGAEWLCKDGKKGSLVVVNGRIEQETWTDKATGANRSKLKVIADQCSVVGGRSGNQQQQEQPQTDGGSSAPVDSSADIPF